jgi:hypothetical protein
VKLGSQLQKGGFKGSTHSTLFAEFINRSDSNQTSMINNANPVSHFLGYAELMRG